MGYMPNLGVDARGRAIPGVLPLAIPRMSAWELSPVLRAMPWGRESILLGLHPESSEDSFPAGFGCCEALLHLMIKFLVTEHSISYHVHPGFELAEMLWSLKHQPLARRPGLAQELRDVADLRGKTEDFLVLDASTEAVFYCGWNREEIDGLRSRLKLAGIGRQGIANALLGRGRAVRLSDLLFERANPGLSRLRADSHGIRLDPAWRELERRFENRYEMLVAEWLAIVVALRPATSLASLTAILLVFALAALEDCFSDLQAGPGINQLRWIAFGENRECTNHEDTRVSESRVSPVCDFFGIARSVQPGSVITVPPGVPHGAGPGLRLVEFSHNSLTTLRCFDHGRGRRLHTVLACIAMAEVDGEVGPGVFEPRSAGEPICFSLGSTQFTVRRSGGADTPLQPGSTHIVTSLSGDLLLYARPDALLFRIPQCHAVVIPPSRVPLPFRSVSASNDCLIIRVQDNDKAE